MDASQYKDVILGLVFLKYVSDAFGERREQIAAELGGQGYNEEQIKPWWATSTSTPLLGFLDPSDAHWASLARNAKAGDIGVRVNQAMDLVMDANPALKATLPRIFNSSSVDQRRLGELIDLFNNARFYRSGRHEGARPVG